MVLATPGPLLTPPPSSSPRRPLSGPTPPKFDPRIKRRTPPPNHPLSVQIQPHIRNRIFDWAGCAVRRTCLRMGARGALRGGTRRQRQHTQTGSSRTIFGALVLCVCGNGIIHRAHQVIQGDDWRRRECCLLERQWRSHLRDYLLTLAEIHGLVTVFVSSHGVCTHGPYREFCYDCNTLFLQPNHGRFRPLNDTSIDYVQ